MLRYQIRRWANRLLRPAFWRADQYAPRAIALPDHYERHPPEDPPTIAIVTPVLNQAAFIRAAIDSVLTQGYPRLAYVVQDGGSTDGTVDILRSYGRLLDWVSLPDSGQADAINRGFARVAGDIMAWLNGDDMLVPGSLAYVARNDQTGAPAKRTQSAFVFAENGSVSGHHQIAISSLRVGWQALPGD